MDINVYDTKRSAILERVVGRRRKNHRLGANRVINFVPETLIVLGSFLWLSIPFQVFFFVARAVLPGPSEGVAGSHWIVMAVAVPYMCWLGFRFLFPAQADIRKLYGEKGQNGFYVTLVDIAELVAARRSQAIGEVKSLRRFFNA